MKKNIFTLLAAASLTLNGFAQDFLGFINSNYAGITGVHLNPANIADSRMKFDMDLAGLNFFAGNNYIGLKREAMKRDKNYFSPNVPNGGFFSHYPAFDDSLFQDKYLIERQDSRTKSVFTSQNINLPSFMFNVGKNTFGFSWRLRNYVNVDGVDPKLAHQIYTGIEDSVQFDQNLENKKLSIQQMVWVEYGATYARTLVQNNEHFLKAGATVKLLQGLGAAYMFVDNLKYMFSHHDTLFLFQSDVKYGHSTNYEFNEGAFKYKYISNINFGLDLGAVYEYRPNHADYKYDMDGETNLDKKWDNKYKLRIGASVLDIGGIRFRKGQYSHNFVADVDNWYVHDLAFDSIPIQAWDDTLRNRFVMDDSEKSFKMNLPTALSLQVDYNIWKPFYINMTIYQAMQFKNNPNKVHDISVYSLTPRVEGKWFGFYLPFSYNSFGNFNIGTDVRLGPIIFGTNAIGSLLGKTDVFSFDFHFLLKVPVPYYPIKDRDNDKVSDKKDKCRDVPGVWEFMGCPDRDGDHIEDKFDQCPDDPGLKEFNGCPDRDNDKIIDKEDACPDDPGLPQFNGCPDRDGDGIIDKEDDCPDKPGIPRFKGCPDTDGDGLEDKVDKCPEVAGPIENKGCPYDKLILVDPKGNPISEVNVDESGNFMFASLPVDSMAIFKLITYNEPPEIKEVKVGTSLRYIRIAKKGNDGYFRFDILKPDNTKLKKPVEPDVVVVILTKEEQEVLKKAFDNLEFETGKDIIKPESFKSLDELAELLIKKPNWRIQISGHTDNQGKPAANMTLSKKRSEAVKNYLNSKGVGDNRFIVKWYGQTKPIADNKTPQGRQKNRRVEMLIIE